MKNIKNNPDIKFLEKVFKNFSEIEAVYLFGSAASGKMHPESDIDLAIYPDTPGLRKKKVEFVTHLAALPPGAQLRVLAGKRHLTLKAGNIADFEGERGRRGRKLPRGFQRVDGLEVVAPQQRVLM